MNDLIEYGWLSSLTRTLSHSLSHVLSLSHTHTRTSPPLSPSLFICPSLTLEHTLTHALFLSLFSCVHYQAGVITTSLADKLRNAAWKIRFSIQQTHIRMHHTHAHAQTHSLSRHRLNAEHTIIHFEIMHIVSPLCNIFEVTIFK